MNDQHVFQNNNYIFSEISHYTNDHFDMNSNYYGNFLNDVCYLKKQEFMDLLLNNNQNIQYNVEETNNIDNTHEYADCISFDEGYYGSYNDQINLNSTFKINQNDLNCGVYLKEHYHSQDPFNSIKFINSSCIEHSDSSDVISFDENLSLNLFNDVWNYEQNTIELEPGFKIYEKGDDSSIEDTIDIQAYLYEIELNFEYFKNDLLDFQDFLNQDYLIEKPLSFNSPIDACSMLLYEQEVSKQMLFYLNHVSNFELCDGSSYIENIEDFNLICSSDYLENELISVQSEKCGEVSYKNYSENDNITNGQLDYKINISDDGLNLQYDIFENVYNYIPSDETDSNENQQSNSIFSTKLDSVSLSSSSSPSSYAQLSDSRAIPRLAKSAKDIFRKPCVYMLNEGRCMRSDCRFAHDLHNITCKYWLEGECLKGESCEFLHDFPKISSDSLDKSSAHSFSIIQNLDIDTTKTVENDFNLNNLDFPELGTKVKSNKQPTTTVNDGKIINNQVEKLDCSYSNNNLDQFKNFNEDQNCEEFPSLNAVKSASSLGKKSRKFKENVLYSLSLPGYAITSRKKNIN